MMDTVIDFYSCDAEPERFTQCELSTRLVWLSKSAVGIFLRVFMKL